MIEAFKIAAILEIQGNFNRKLQEFSRSADVFKVNINRLEKQVQRLSVSLNNIKIVNPFSQMNESLVMMKRNLDEIGVRTEALRGRSGVGGARREGGGFGKAAKYGTMLAMGGFGGLPLAAMIGAGIGRESYLSESSYERELMKFQMQGFSAKDTAAANRFVGRQNIAGVSRIDMMKAFVDAAMVTHSASMARQLSPTLARYNFANQQFLRGNYTQKDEQDLISFAEMRGKGNVGETQKFLKVGEQMLLGEGGRVKPGQLRQFLKFAAVAGYNLSPKALMESSSLIQELGGQRAGVGLRTGFQQLIGLTGMSNQKGSILTQMGLLKPGFITHDPWGHVVKHKFGALKDQYSTMLQENPFDFMDVFIKKASQMGFTGQEKVAQLAAFSFNPTFAQDVSAYMKQRSKIHRALGREEAIQHPYAQAFGLESAQMGMFTTSLSNFTKALGKATRPLVIDGLKTLTMFVNFFTKLMDLLGKKSVSNAISGISAAIPNALTGGIYGEAKDFISSHVLNNLHDHKEVATSHVVIDPHEFMHAVSPAMGRAASKPLSTVSGINLFETRPVTGLNRGF